MKSKISPVKISTIIAGLVALWVFSGVFAGNEAVVEKKADAVPSVKVVGLIAQKRFNNIELSGKTQASREVDLRIEVAGKVEKIIAQDGAILKKDAPIVQMDSRSRYENLRRAKAEVEEKRTYYNAAKRLMERELQSEVGVSKANSEYEMAKSSLKDAQVEVGNITLKAPFDGQLEKVVVEVGEYLQVGDMVAKFIDYDPFEVIVKVPESHISEMHVGKEVGLKLANGADFMGKISFIAAIANDDTRTYDVAISVDGTKEGFFDGMTAEVKIPLDEAMAHQISPAYFSLSTDGKIGVKIVEGGEIAKFVEVETVEDDAEGVWVSGLPEKVEVIATGHEYVLDGQKVNATR